MSRLVALVVLTAAFAPAAVLGALPLVAPVVGLVTVLLLLFLDNDSAAEPVSTEPAVERADPVEQAVG
jgi:hypothetical protein